MMQMLDTYPRKSPTGIWGINLDQDHTEVRVGYIVS